MIRQRGSALLLILLVLGVLGAFFAVRTLNDVSVERDKVSAAALAQAKEALIGYAATYRDQNANQMFGYLPCPDMDNNVATLGQADPADALCGVQDISTVRRLPWNTLGLGPLRDSGGECLWYAVSGHAKANTSKTAVFNWDTLGQFVVQDVDGTALHGASEHDRPMGVVLAPRAAINALSRAGPATECRGSNTIAAYLDGGVADPIYAGFVPAAKTTTTFVLSTKASATNGINNDQGTLISSKDIFDRVKVRSDFKTDVDTMMADLAVCLNNLPPNVLANTSAGNKGVDTMIGTCPAAPGLKANVLANWRNNLLYTKPAAASTVSGSTGCAAVLLFAGERTQRTLAPLGPQIRVTPAQTGDAALFGDPAMYLEGPNTIFPASGDYMGAGDFTAPANAAVASADVVRCIKGLPAGATQVSFAQNIASFGGVGAGVTPDLAAKTVNIADAAGAAGGCFWAPTVIPLAGKTLRAYYDFKFSFADDFAVGGPGSDRGNGFTLQFVTGQWGAPPNTCGTEAAMGALGAADVWGLNSFIVETDVHKDGGLINDPTENHTTIMLNGNLGHTGPGDTMSAACNGTAAGCRHAPASKFEESPLALHNQRTEIHTGCNATCTACSPANHVAPNTYAKISTWVDCVDCNDVVADLLGAELISASVNRHFGAAGNWAGTNWSVAAGAFSHLAGINAATLPNAALTSPPVAGTTYQVAFTAVTATPGALAVSFGGTSADVPLVLGIPVGTPSNHTVQLTAISAGVLTMTPTATWTGSMDNVSIKPLKIPSINRCVNMGVAMYPAGEMNSVYFGFTGGFRSGASQQGVTLKNLILRSE